MTEQVKILGWIYVVVNAAVLAVGLVVCAGLALDGSPATTVQIATGLYLTIAITLLLPGLLGGIGLLRSKRWGRVVLIVLSAVNLALFPLGTVLGVYGLWVLLGNGAGPRSTSGVAPAGQSAGAVPGARAGHQLSGGGARTQQSRGPLLLTIAGGAAAFLVIVGVGYIVSHTPFEVLKLNPGLRSAAVIALVLGAFFAWRAIATFGQRRQRQTAVSARAQAAKDEWGRRIEELAADPARRKYAALVERGEPWSDEQIAYDEEPTRTATCVHLQPIERTMRAAGIRVKRWTGSYVDANCRIQPEELKRSFPEAPVSYREYFESERAGTQDFPMARIFCDQCRSAISVIHPLEAKQETPWFPRL